MKRILITFCGLMILLTGCSFPEYTGYVTDREDGRILIVSSESTGSNFYDALWASGVPEHIEIGERVEVWVDGVAESYPGQAEAERIKVISGDTPEAADLTEAEAISRALDDEDSEKMLAVTSTEFKEEEDEWIVEIVSAKKDDMPGSDVRIKGQK